METLIRPIINEWLADKTKVEACEIFMAQGLPCGPVQNSEDVAHDEHTKKREMIVTLPDPIIGKISMVGCPIKMEEHEPTYKPLPEPRRRHRRGPQEPRLQRRKDKRAPRQESHITQLFI